MTQKALIVELLELIDLHKISDNVFEGISRDFVGERVFGGQVLAQALMAASHTADRPAHSLHSYFLNGGDVTKSVTYTVTPLKNGRSLQSRQVVARQGETILFTALISFAMPEEGLDYQTQHPRETNKHFKPVDELPNEQQLKEKFEAFIPKKYHKQFMRERHVEIRPLKMRNFLQPPVEEPQQGIWLRVTDNHNLLPEVSDYKTHQALFAFMSDYYLLATSLYPHGVSFMSHKNLQAATIDHSIHFHQNIDASQWFLYDMSCEVTSHTRGLSHGKVWQADKLVATTQQEGLIRLREKAASASSEEKKV